VAWLIKPPPVCRICLYKVYERLDRDWAFPEKDFEPIEPPRYEDESLEAVALIVRAETRWGDRAQRKENQKACLEAARCWKQLNNHAEQLVASGKLKGEPDTAFGIVDNRSFTPAAAAPIVMGPG
jgi:hypothetical protein